MKINAFPSYYHAVENMAELAIMDRLTFIECQPKLHEMKTEEEKEELKKLIHETSLEISDFEKIKKYARSKLI